MKYFTAQLWIGFNSPRRNAAFKVWDRRLKSYRKALRKILPGLSSHGQGFFRDVLILHDGTLACFEVGDRLANPLGEFRRGDINGRKVSARMSVLSAGGDRVYELVYKCVKKVELDFPGKVELFPAGEYPNFGDWGYDELTAPKKGLFRHEILFASGATIAVEFRGFAFHRRPAKN